MYCSVFTQSQKTVYCICICIWLKYCWPLSTRMLVLNKGGVHCWALGRDPQLRGDHHTVIPSPPKLDTAIRHWVAVVVLVCGHSAPMDQAIVVVVVHHGGIVFQLLIHDSTVRRLNQPLVKLFCESNQLGPGSAHYVNLFFTSHKSFFSEMYMVIVLMLYTIKNLHNHSSSRDHPNFVPQCQVTIIFFIPPTN